MRILELSKHEFDNYLFPTWANAQNPGDPELVVRVTRKLKSISQEKPLLDSQQKARDEGKVVFADRTLDGEEGTLFLEEDEWKALRDMFEKSLRNFTTLAMEGAVALSEKIKTAKSADVAEDE